MKLFDEQCTCKLYADDLKLYTCTNFSDGASTLQKYLAKLVHWSQIWQFNISHKKCSILPIANTTCNQVFCLGPNPLHNVSTVKDLGIFVDDRLTFNCYINYIVASVSARDNLIHKCLTSKDVTTMTSAFVVYLRPLLEYASPEWSPTYLKI